MSGKIFVDKGPDAFSLHGRINRIEWLWATIQCTAMTVLAAMIPIIGPIVALPFAFRLVAVAARRLHDSELSAWLLAVPLALLYGAQGLFLAFQNFGLADYGRLMGEAIPNEVTLRRMLELAGNYHSLGNPTPLEWIPIVTWWVAIFSLVIAVVAILVAPGTNGPNRYGEADRR